MASCRHSRRAVILAEINCELARIFAARPATAAKSMWVCEPAAPLADGLESRPQGSGQKKFCQNNKKLHVCITDAWHPRESVKIRGCFPCLSYDKALAQQ
jgi:hypothetical protein